MTANYRAFVHYHFKKGLEEEGILFLERELVKKAAQWGCHNIEIWQHEEDPHYVIGVAEWTSFDEAKKFQSQWHKKEEQMIQMCTNAPEREFYKLRTTFKEKSKRAA